MKIRRIKKWMNMLLGKGTLHVKKQEGKNWSKEYPRGFYIDYSGKLATKQINENGLPYTKLENGTTAVIPITVIQYGFGCYEAMLEGHNEYRDGFYKCADYMLSTQANDGSWEAFAAQKSRFPRSSMVQGEAASLFVRAYVDSNDEKYLNAAKAACKLMLEDKSNGGTAETVDGHKILLEGTGSPMILNGAIYSMFGLLDMWILTKDAEYKKILDDVVEGIKMLLPKYDIGYWSLYCLSGAITSPFYHQLHITQLRVLAKIFDDTTFSDEADKYERYYNNRFYYARAFVKKAIQKLSEKSDTLAIVE